MAKEQVTHKPDAFSDELNKLRSTAQELHRAISNTVAKRTSASKAEVEGVIQKAKEAADSAKAALNARQDSAQAAIKQQLTQAAEKLDNAHKQAAESLKSSGEAFHAALSKALGDVRVALQKTSEAIAARRSGEAAKHSQVKKAS